jgi:hypothetical protein
MTVWEWVTAVALFHALCLCIFIMILNTDEGE